jgi:large subunit ribosomal protein L30e
MILLASNCPKDAKEQIEYLGKLSKVPVIEYKGASMDLAAVSNKLFTIAALSIREPGDSDILKLAENAESQNYLGGNE